MASKVKSNRQERINRLAYDYEGQPKEIVETCAICSGTIFVTISHSDRYNFPAQAKACKNCGFVFLSPRPTATAYLEFYQRIYRPLVSAYHGRDINAITIQGEQAEYANRLLKFLSGFIKEKHHRTLLDVGGSTGVVAEMIANKFGLSATVIDPAEAELEEARKKGLTTILGFIEKIDPANTNYDLILLCQTIDHLLDVKYTLGHIYSILSPNGLFFVDIVDFRSAYLRHQDTEQAIKVDHTYYFTEPTIEVLLSQIGFEIVAKEYAQDGLHIGYLCRKNSPEPMSKLDQTSVSQFFRELRSIQSLPLSEKC